MLHTDKSVKCDKVGGHLIVEELKAILIEFKIDYLMLRIHKRGKMWTYHLYPQEYRIL